MRRTQEVFFQSTEKIKVQRPLPLHDDAVDVRGKGNQIKQTTKGEYNSHEVVDIPTVDIPNETEQSESNGVQEWNGSKPLTTLVSLQ